LSLGRPRDRVHGGEKHWEETIAGKKTVNVKKRRSPEVREESIAEDFRQGSVEKILQPRTAVEQRPRSWEAEASGEGAVSFRRMRPLTTGQVSESLTAGGARQREGLESLVGGRGRKKVSKRGGGGSVHREHHFSYWRGPDLLQKPRKP